MRKRYRQGMPSYGSIFTLLMVKCIWGRQLFSLLRDWAELLQTDGMKRLGICYNCQHRVTYKSP